MPSSEIGASNSMDIEHKLFRSFDHRIITDWLLLGTNLLGTMDYVDYGIWVLEEKAKGFITQVRLYLGTDEFQRKRDRMLEFAFAFQMQLVVGMSIYFAKDATDGIRTIFAEHCVSFISFISAAISALLACAFICLSMATMPQYMSHIAYTLSWGAPLTVGVTIASFQCQKQSWESQYPIFKIAVAVYLTFSAGFYWFHRHLRYSSTILKTALKSLSFHPRLFRQTISIIVVLNLWTVAWCVAVFGIYQWARQQEVPAAHTAVFDENDEYSSFFRIIGSLSVKQQSLLPEQGINLPWTVLAFLFASLYWTQQTCRDLTQVATASAVGLWWRSGSPKTDASFISVLPLSFGKLFQESFRIHQTRAICRIMAIVRFISEFSGKSSRETVRKAQPLRQNSGRLSLLYLGYYGSDREPTMPPEYEEKVRRGALEAIWRDRRLDHFLSLCIFAVAMTSASLSWLLDSTNSLESFFLGFICGWISGDSILAVVKAAADSNFLGVSEFEPDGNLLRTNMYFALKKELL